MDAVATAPVVPSPSAVDAEASRIVAEIGIPPCPAVLTAMLRETRKDDPDFQAIGKLIASDLALAAALLKTVNSPFYGLRSKATSVQQALVFIGLKNVVRLVTGLLLQQAFPVSRNQVVKLLWETSARIAAGAACLARALRCCDADEAYTFGLFRDCGMLLMTRKHADYAPLLEAAPFPHPDAFAAAESARYVTDHARVGFHMASSWYLPAELCLAVRHHHDRAFAADAPRGARTLVALGAFVDAVLAGRDLEAGEPALGALGLDAARAQALAEDVRQACDAATGESP